MGCWVCMGFSPPFSWGYVVKAVNMTVQVNVCLRERCAIADCTCQTKYWLNVLATIQSALQRFYRPSLPGYTTLIQLPGRAL